MRLVALLVAGGLALAGCAQSPDAEGHGGDGGDPAASTATVDGPTPNPTEDVATTDVATVDCRGTADADHPDVVDATVEADGGGTFTVAATLCSAYDSADRYADAFRVVVAGTDEVLGVRELTHPHAEEQPFTRSLTDVAIPDGVTEVVVEGRDRANGWGGATVTVEVPSGG